MAYPLNAASFLNPWKTPLYKSWWDMLDYPHRMLDQHFGMGLFDHDLQPLSVSHGYLLRPRNKSSISSSGISEVIFDKDKFQIQLDVSLFEAEEIDLSRQDDFVVVHAKHEERPDEHGSVSREFKRRYLLPPEVDSSTITASLSADKIMTISALRKKLRPEDDYAITVPIKVISRFKEGVTK